MRKLETQPRLATKKGRGKCFVMPDHISDNFEAVLVDGRRSLWPVWGVLCKALGVHNASPAAGGKDYEPKRHHEIELGSQNRVGRSRPNNNANGRCQGGYLSK